MAKGLNLSREEGLAFELLVQLDRAQSDEERTRILRQLRASRLRRRLKEDEFELYSTWWAVPIRELLTLTDAPKTATGIAQRLWPRVSTAEANAAIELLKKLGLAARDADGRLRTQNNTLETAPQVKSLGLRNYHRHMLQRAAESLDSLPPEERNVTSVTLKLTPAEAQELNQRISDFQDQLLGAYDAANAEPHNLANAEIYNVSFAAVPVTKKAQ